jgi:signal transduction histidine kinase
MTNILRHAKATKAQVTLTHNRDGVALEVKDNGIGIADKAISDSRSFGLIGIRERVIFRGGEFSIHGLKNTGTTVKISLPLQQPKA